MKLLIIEPDLNFALLLEKAIEVNFKNLDVTFEKDPDRIPSLLEEKAVDLAIIECALPKISVFDIVTLFEDRNIPVILMADDPSPRLVVEGMRAGALDFIVKKDFDEALFFKLVLRVFLEADRWQRIHEFVVHLGFPRRTLLSRLDSELKNLALGEIRPAEMEGQGKRHLIPKDGQECLMTFINIQLYPGRLLQTGQDDLVRVESIKNKILGQLTRIQEESAGILWARHENNLLFAFINETASWCMQTVFLIFGYMNVLKFSLYEFDEKPAISLCMTSGSALYRENKGELYSEALNLSAHLASEESSRNRILISSEIFPLLKPIEQRYFGKAEQYRDYNLYEFLNI